MAEENENKGGNDANSAGSSDTTNINDVNEIKDVTNETDATENNDATDVSALKERSMVPVEEKTAKSDDLIEKSSEDNTLTDPKNVSEAEGQVKKLPYPKSIFFIISNEFCERFNYYGMRTVLVLYLSRQLDYSDDAATIIFHIFTMAVYFLCVLGAIISDSWLGKFKTIMYLSMVYVCGSVMVALGAMPPLHLPGVTFTMIGLTLIALGSGGIKPCVSAFGGDQFKLPEQVKQMTTFFSLFYFTINSGSLISTSVTPILREDVHCFGEKECYSLAFGVPAILMIVSIIVFVLGRPLYKSKPPAGNMVVLVSKTIGNAISTKWKEKKTNPREHWLDYADKKYDRQLIEDVKVLMRVLVLYLPLPVFWALFDQQGSRWTFQATRMNGDMGSWDIKPDQVQVLNPLLILVFIPLYDVAFYPALRLIGVSRPLQKLTLGGILAGVAFIISAVVELNLENTYPVLPMQNNAQLRIYNGNSCNYTITTNIPGLNSFDLKERNVYTNKDITVNGVFNIDFKIESTDDGCQSYTNQQYAMKDKKAYYLFLGNRNISTPLHWGEDFVEKPSKGSPLARTFANVAEGSRITWKTAKKETVEHQEDAYQHNITEFSKGEYKVLVGDKEIFQTSLELGGVYTILTTQTADGSFQSELIEVTEPNSVNILWLIPQYVVLTLGEVMFSVTGLEFSYSQSPISMKSVLQACWLLTVAFGNVIVIIIAELSLFDSQANEFFLFAGLMFVDMIVFMFLAYRYVPNDPMKNEETEPLTKANHEIQPLEGVDNKAKETDD
ncbi:peptide transporter family 1 [Teleopsis dalmanni]|uniref:peptide transporter family 1 n=1 Tax=Teleopsis dalmanni TaxID=139649 RepID=UPI000D32BC39|nr:peptide transporter family 1 [Teleopsis dalmanni]